MPRQPLHDSKVDNADSTQTDAELVVISWTPTREKLRVLLQDIHPDVADLYAHAIDSFAVSPPSRPLLMVGSHCIRELVPSLLQLLQLETPARADASRAAKDLANSWEAYGLRLDEDGVPRRENELLPVPLAVYAAARSVAAAGSAGSQNARTITALLALGHTSEINSAPLRRLHDSLEEFRRWSHHSDYTKPLKNVPSIEEVEAQLLVFEEALMTRFANRGDRVSALRKRLNRANEREAEVGDV